MQEFRDKRMMGHVFTLQLLKSNYELVCSFLDYFFFYRSLKLVHLHIFAQMEARFTMSTYLCIQCAQRFLLSTTLQSDSKDISIEMTKGIF